MARTHNMPNHIRIDVFGTRLLMLEELFAAQPSAQIFSHQAQGLHKASDVAKDGERVCVCTTSYDALDKIIHSYWNFKVIK